MNMKQAKWYDPLTHRPEENKLCVAIFSDEVKREYIPVILVVSKVQPRTGETYFKDIRENTLPLCDIKKYCYAEDLLNEVLNRE